MYTHHRGMLTRQVDKTLLTYVDKTILPYPLTTSVEISATAAALTQEHQEHCQMPVTNGISEITLGDGRGTLISRRSMARHGTYQGRALHILYALIRGIEVGKLGCQPRGQDARMLRNQVLD